MVKRGAWLLGGMLAAAMPSARAANAEAQRMSLSAVEEFGLIHSGRYLGYDFHNDWLDHFGVSAGRTAALSEDLKFDVGLGGVFAYQKQEVVLSQWTGTQYKNFQMGPTVADIRYGSVADDKDGFGFQFGMFNYKYNADAHDLGEYLFRSGAYPDYLVTGGNILLDNSAVQLQGLKANFKRGNLSADFVMTTETALPAFYDFSPALVGEYKSDNGLFDVGAGMNWKHLISVRPSHTSAHVPANAYFEKDGVWYTGFSSFYDERSKFYVRREAEDTANRAAYAVLASQDSAASVNVDAWLKDPAAAGISPQYYTQRGILLMAHASLDPKVLFASSLFGPEDLRLYCEAALLGVQNYQVFYEKRSERIPVMIGFNLPGFHILDLISVQAEYFGSPYMNSYGALFGYTAIPGFPQGIDTAFSRTAYNDMGKRDNWTWSILARKNFARVSWISAQLARDHMRVASQSVWAGPGWVPNEVLGSPKDWYLMFQFGFAI